MTGYIIRLPKDGRRFVAAIGDPREAATLVCTKEGLKRQTLMGVSLASQFDLRGLSEGQYRQI